jgi:hypothetical protein
MLELRDKERAAEPGLDDANSLHGAIRDAMDVVYDHMLELTPTSLEGCRALALGIVAHFHGDEIIREEGPEGDGIALLLSALTGLRSRPERLDQIDDEPSAA